MTQPANTNRPVDEVRIGRVKATIWRNETEAPLQRRRRRPSIHPTKWDLSPSSGVIVAAPLGSSPHRRSGVSAATTPPGGVRR